MQCCISEKGYFNKYYGLLAQKLCKYDSQSFKYSIKYSLWDYLKQLGKYDIRQNANLAKLFGMLVSDNDCPLHFLKILNFDDISKP